MSSKQHMFELNGKKYGFSLPEGQEPTEDLLQKIVEKIEKREKEKAQKMYSVASGAGGAPDDEKVEDKNVIDTQAGVEDAMAAKNNALTQGVQENFENVAEEKADEKSISDDPKEFFMATAPTIESAAEELAIDVANSDTAQAIAAQAIGAELSMSVAMEGLEVLEQQEDDAYLFVDKNAENEGLLDVNAHKQDTLQKEEGILNRNVSEKEKASDDILGVEVKDLVEIEAERNVQSHHLSPVQELEKESQDKKLSEKTQENVGSASKEDLAKNQDLEGAKEKNPQLMNVENSKERGNGSFEKSGSEKTTKSEKEQEKLKSEKSLSAKEEEKSKKMDKTSQAKQKGDTKGKRKVSAAEIRKILGATGRPVKKNSGKTKSSPYQYSRIIDNANSKNSAVLNMAKQVKRGRGN